MPTHIMLDLETWGTTPGCDIRSIGACVFDPVTGYVAHADGTLGDDYFYLATDNPRGYWGKGSARDRFFNKGFGGYKYRLSRDSATVQWWADQSEEAQAAFADPVDLKVGLRRFALWLQNVTGEKDVFPPACKIWSHGPAFDPPILAAAYRAVGLPVPWHYRAPRDTRTLFDLAGIEDHSAWLSSRPGPLGIPHHALDDAICQARAVCDAWRMIG